MFAALVKHIGEQTAVGIDKLFVFNPSPSMFSLLNGTHTIEKPFSNLGISITHILFGWPNKHIFRDRDSSVRGEGGSSM